MLDSALFYFFAGVAVLSAALMITRRNPSHSAVFLITTLLGTAGIFLQLRAEFLFAAQILVYAGATMLLFLFAILFVRFDVTPQQNRIRKQKLVAAFVALALGLELVVVLLLARQLPGEGLFVSGSAAADRLPPNSEALASSLFSDYLLAFEMTGVLLLVAMVGAVVTLKNRKKAGAL
jgi:NADH-quinone oxidoreductase subunit J